MQIYINDINNLQGEVTGEQIDPLSETTTAYRLSNNWKCFQMQVITNYESITQHYCICLFCLKLVKVIVAVHCKTNGTPVYIAIGEIVNCADNTVKYLHGF